MQLLAKILLTIVTLGYSLVPLLADFNKTHASNPDWTGHARFHVVWQVSSYVGFALVALYLIWLAGAGTTGLWLAAIMAACAYAGFFAAVLARPIYGGKLYDRSGYPPYSQNLLGMGIEGDVNVTVFGTIVGLLVVSVLVLLGLPAQA